MTDPKADPARAPDGARDDGARPREGSARIYVRSLMANWFGFGANLVVLFFLTPFVVRSLGSAAYGVWSLLMMVTGYLGLVEVGVRASTGRYINYYLGRRQPEKVSDVVNTSLAFYAGVGVLALAIAALLGAFLGEVFPKVPPEFVVKAKWVLLLCALNVWVGLMLSTFGQLLCSLNRFDLRNVVNLVVLAVRAGGTLWVLSTGGGLVGLSVIQVLSGLAGLTLVYWFARWKGPEVRFGRRYVSGDALRELVGFGKWAFLGNISLRVICYTDAAVIGWLIGVEEITLYSLGLMLVDHGVVLIGHIVGVVTPDLEKAGGRRAMSELRWMVLATTRTVAFFAVPLFVGVMVMAPRFFVLWMGQGEFLSSGFIAGILAAAHIAALTAKPSRMTLHALGDVRFVGVTVMVEAALNLGLSVLFVAAFGWGLYGVALGTLVPMVAVTGVVIPARACRCLQLDALEFVRSTAARWVAAALLFAVVCAAIDTAACAASFPAFFAAAGAAAAAYVPIGFLLILTPGERRAILGLLGGRTVAVEARPGAVK